MMLSEDKLEADRFICKFSELMRKTLHHSDKITYTLKDEIEYIENFIQLQKIRYCNRFDYLIDINANVKENMLVPKHFLYTYVENSIKHGLSKKNRDGLLKIYAYSKKNSTLFTIEDNGSGINKSEVMKPNSTGNGLVIMQHIFNLYSRITGKKISHSITDILDNESKKCGVKVEIILSN